MGNKKSKRQKSNDQQVLVTIPANFDYQKFADAMFQAQLRAKEQEKDKKEKDSQIKQNEWHNILKYKEYPNSKYKISNWFHSARNGFVVFYKMMTLKRKEAKFDTVTVSLLHFALNEILALIKWTFYIIALSLAISSFYSFEEKVAIPFRFIFLCYGGLSFVFARIVRIAQFEVDHINEREYLIGILSAITSFVAMIIAVIALFK